MKPENPTDSVVYVQYIPSPIGILRAVETDGALIGLTRTSEPVEHAVEQESLLLGNVREELKEYFAGERREFTIPLSPAGTPFQQKVWQTLLTVPYGETISYGEEARRMGSKCARAVGSANGRNPICILIPCHRIIKSDGTIGGYTGGLDMKEFLLKLEKKNR